MTPTGHAPMRAFVFTLVLSMAGAWSASAQQAIGPLSWRLQPYCNLVTVTLTPAPAGFTIAGTDDLCGAPDAGSVVGVAAPNAGGNYRLNFTIVTAPAALPVFVSAVVSPASGSGTWTDSLGNSGAFLLFGNPQGAPARPLPASGVRPGSITATEIAPGAVGATTINPLQVQARVTGSCGLGEAMTGVNADGTVLCALAAPFARFRAQNANDLMLAGGASGVVTWGAASYNVGFGAYDAVAGTYAVPSAGVYLITASVEFSPVAGTGIHCLVLTVGGLDGQATCGPQNTSIAQIPMLSTVRTLAAGAVLAIRASNSASATQTVSGINSTSEFTVTRIQ